MKKESNNGMKITQYTNIEAVPNLKDFGFPFETSMLSLLKKENLFKQDYYWVKRKNEFAFIIVYHMKMNIFTYSKFDFSINTSVVGFPCSLCEEGFVTNSLQLVLDFAKTIKGPVLLLNIKNPVQQPDFVQGETLPTCILNLKFKDERDYLNSLRSSYRRRILLAVNRCDDIEMKEINDDSIDVYSLYLNTYQKSNYKLEKLEKGFFDKVNATKLVFFKGGKPVGFVLLKKNKKRLIFMLCGMDYTHDTTDLYFYMLFQIVKYGIKLKCNDIEFGQTSELTKLKFGSFLEKRFFYAHHSNSFFNFFIKHGKGLLEYKYSFPNFRVFKEE